MEPLLIGRHVTLRPLTPTDYGPILWAEQSPALGPRWRLRGGTPSPGQFEQMLWNNVLAQFIVCETPRQATASTEMPPAIGLVSCYAPNFRDQHAYLQATSLRPRERSPLLMLAMMMFIEYVFDCFPMRKLYLETMEYNYRQFSSGLGKIFEIEGRLRDHQWLAGRHWDQLTLAIYRETWKEFSPKIIAAERPRPQQYRVTTPELPR